MNDNPFELDPDGQKDFDKRFWEAWPRWKFHNGWASWNGLRGFSLFNIWWSKGGSVGVVFFSFGIEFNPHHKEETE